MTENESILSTLQNGIVCATDDITREDLEMMVKCLEELQQYRAIGTIEEFKALKEKNVAKKPIGEYTQCKCSVCGRRVRSGRGSSSFVRDNFCQRCGQKLDWQ